MNELIEDKKQFAKRWGLCERTVGNLLRRGLPHIKIGKRIVRINAQEADAWMKRTYGA